MATHSRSRHWHGLGAAVAFALFLLLGPHSEVVAADAPSQHFVVDGDLVRDTATKLSWQRATAEGTYSFDDAQQYCASLDLEGTGWRVPTLKELHTLVDEARVRPAIDPRAFPATASDYYWSGTAVASHADNAWAISFAYGYDNFFRLAEKQHLRCVR